MLGIYNNFVLTTWTIHFQEGMDGGISFSARTKHKSIFLIMVSSALKNQVIVAVIDMTPTSGIDYEQLSSCANSSQGADLFEASVAYTDSQNIEWVSNPHCKLNDVVSAAPYLLRTNYFAFTTVTGSNARLMILKLSSSTFAICMKVECLTVKCWQRIGPTPPPACNNTAKFSTFPAQP